MILQTFELAHIWHPMICDLSLNHQGALFLLTPTPVAKLNCVFGSANQIGCFPAEEEAPPISSVLIGMWRVTIGPPNNPPSGRMQKFSRCYWRNDWSGMPKKEWGAWHSCFIKLEMTLYIFIYGHIFQITWVDWLWYTWSEARYTAINVRPSLSRSVPWLLTRG